MKKIVKVIIFIMLALPFAVKADVAAPTYFKYDVVCNRDSGCPVYSDYDMLLFEKMLDKNQVITIKYSFKKDNGALVYYFNDSYAYATDFVNDKEFIEPTDEQITKLANKIEAVVVSSEGTSLRKGPSDSFTEITKVPYKTKFKVLYGFKDENSGYLNYFYGEYKGKKGWVEVGSDEDYVAFKTEEVIELKTYKPITIGKKEYEANKVLKVNFMTKHNNYYYEDKSANGLITSDDVAYKVSFGKYVTNRTIEIVEDTKTNKKIGTIPAGEYFYPEYEGYDDTNEYKTINYYYITYKDKSGWIVDDTNKELTRYINDDTKPEATTKITKKTEDEKTTKSIDDEIADEIDKILDEVDVETRDLGDIINNAVLSVLIVFVIAGIFIGGIIALIIVLIYTSVKKSNYEYDHYVSNKKIKEEVNAEKVEEVTEEPKKKTSKKKEKQDK